MLFSRRLIAMLLSVLVVDSSFAQNSNAEAGQSTATVAATPPIPPADAAQLQTEVATLSERMRLLEQRIKASSTSKMQHGTGGPTGTSGQPMSAGTSIAAMRDDNMGTPKAGCCGAQMMGMGAMSSSKSPAAMAVPSSLPGFPGQSHLYHIGATGFFLDHSQHIALTPQQQQGLAHDKQQSVLQQNEMQRQIDAAEEKLWQLTGADRPQLDSIDKQVREIERLRADQRIAFIRAVGRAGTILTDEQRQQLTGMAPAQQTADKMPDM